MTTFRFLVDARFCTRNGTQGSWSGVIDAPNISTALELAGQTVVRRHRGATKLDLHARPDPSFPPADVNDARSRTDDG